MTEVKRPLKVFLCHATADKPKVRELYHYLKKRGIQPWLDAEDLLPGQAWQVEIPKAIETSDAIIICLSKSSVDKEGYVQKEIKSALDKALGMPEDRIFLIPARFEECDLPRLLSVYHWVDLFDEDGYKKLMKSLKHRAAQLQRTTIQTPKLDETTPKLVEQPEQESDTDISKQKTAWAAPIVTDVAHLFRSVNSDEINDSDSVNLFELGKIPSETPKSELQNASKINRDKNNFRFGHFKLGMEELSKLAG